jgi:hypothetical protein
MLVHHESMDEPGFHWDDISTLRDTALLDESDDSIPDHRPRPSAEESAEGEYATGDAPAAIYLRDISRVKLLTAEQEVELAKALEQGKLAHESLADPSETLGPEQSLKLGSTWGAACPFRT